MLITFGQAKNYMTRHMSSASMKDIGDSINVACTELSFTKNWRNLRRTIRMSVTNEYFALPQEFETVIRVAINGTPVLVHGSEIEFLFSGPGDFDYVTEGYAPTNGVQDMGWFPTMYTPSASSTLAFFSTNPPTGKIQVRGTNADGDAVTEEIEVNTWSGVTDIDNILLGDVAHSSSGKFVEITNIILPADVTDYISLYGFEDVSPTFLSRMHPSIKIPRFRRYRMPGFSSTEGYVYKAIAEVRVRFLPLVSDEDVLPFDTVLPVQYMLRSLWKMDADDVKGADDYRMRAEAALIRMEEPTEEKQGVVVVNSVYDGSPGQMSAEYFYNL